MADKGNDSNKYELSLSYSIELADGSSDDVKKSQEAPVKKPLENAIPVRKCEACGKPVSEEEFAGNLFVCPLCGKHSRIDARRRIESLVDAGTFEEWNTDIEEINYLGTEGYEDKLKSAREKTGLDEAIVTGKGYIDGHVACIGVMDCRFMMASMGSVAGEKITRMFERAADDRLPVIMFTASGGARMQEGIVSLMQMAKTSAAVKRHSDKGLLYITVLTDPTTGGVTASFAMLGDIILAEPGALVGFAGPRVIEQTIGQKLPEGFQRAEFQLEHGFADAIVPRGEMKQYLGNVLKIHEDGERFVFEQAQKNTVEPCRKELTPWDKVLISRGKNRPVAQDYIEALFPDFIEFHGDRYAKDDKAVMGGIATFGGRAVTVIAESKGIDLKSNIERNFGMPSPDGYRKALRLMKEAEKFGRPVICFIDTPGAYCGLEAEERGQGEAIARNLYEMSSLKVPVLSVIISEAGSGGALALGVADRVLMLENAIYAILSPEGYSSILWKDSKRAPEAAAVMKLTASDMLSFGIVEKVISEPDELTRETLPVVAGQLASEIALFIEDNLTCDADLLRETRYQRYRKFGS